MKINFLYFFLIALSTSCSSDYTPKPRGYFYIQLPEPVYRDLVRYPFFKCSISNRALVEESTENKRPGKKDKPGIEFNLNYPDYHAQIYCSCFRINPKDFPGLAEDSRKMAYVWERKVKEVTETTFSRPEQKIYAWIYEIEGNPVCPVRFFISDSTRSFFRGALYFDTAFNRDSIAPVLTYINKDIHVMIESFQWKQ